jgi:hypothetical protein
MRRHVHKLRSIGSMLFHHVGGGRCLRQHLDNSHYNHMRRHTHHEDEEGGDITVNAQPVSNAVQSSLQRARRYTPLKFKM